jgi:protein-S-isoprenylcysteine O-methyltransferase Ste14
MMLLRHLLSIAILPFSVGVLVPIWIARRNGVTPAIAQSAGELAFQLAGLALLGVGLVLFTASLRRFATEGDGTLAPWDPPRKLVVRGPYQYVRNPMISGVIFVLFAESLVLLSGPHAAWAAAVLVVNLIYIPLIEEPMMVERFGDDYSEYCRHVGRIVPRLSPWKA